MYPYNAQNNESNTKTTKTNSTEQTIYTVNTDDKLLALLEEVLGDELSDYEYYKRFQMLFDEPKDREIIRHISLDEMKHKKIIENIYTEISGKKPPIPKIEDIKITRNIPVELAKKIAGEYDGEELYRKIYFLLDKPEYRDMLFELLTDENIHAGKLTYLYSKYK